MYIVIGVGVVIIVFVSFYIKMSIADKKAKIVKKNKR